jgi:uncharacterized protein (DUF433 family)
MEQADTQKNFQEIELKDYDCFFAEYKDQMRPIFYIKLPVLMNLFELYKQEKHRVFEQLQENENEDEIYILKIEDEGLPFLPVQKDIIQQMICEGELIENLNVKEFVEKHQKQYPHITNEYVEKCLVLLNAELKKTNNDLRQYEIMKHFENSDLSDESCDISSIDTESD